MRVLSILFNKFSHFSLYSRIAAFECKNVYFSHLDKHNKRDTITNGYSSVAKYYSTVV